MCLLLTQNNVIMKKIKLLSMMMLFVMVLPMMVACGDDNGDEPSNKNDDVNVVNGKKLVELTCSFEDKDFLPLVFKIDYDDKGRLSSISYKIQKCDSEYDSQTGSYKYHYYYTGEYGLIATIDYDLRVLSSSYPGGYLSFVLNEQGYISRLGECMLSYDSNGYLTSIDESRGLGTIVYDGADLIKASASNIKNGGMELYYVTYGNAGSNGDLFVRVKRMDDKGGFRRHDIEQDGYFYYHYFKDVMVLIAYQSGLFGKVTKGVLHLKEKSEASSLFEYEGVQKSFGGKITFVCK